MNKAKKRKFKKLAQMMNRQNVSSVFISDELIHVFDLVITDEEADFLLKLNTLEYSYDELETLGNMKDDEFRVFFDTVFRKGLIWRRRREGDRITYSLAPILVGWFEAYLFNGERDDQQVEFSKRLDALFEYWKKFNFSPLRQIRNMLYRFEKPNHKILITPQKEPKQLHTIEVNRTVTDSPTRIETSSEVMNLINEHAERQTIALVHCFCREWHDMIDQPCSFNMPREGCIVIGDFAEHVIKAGAGRSISKEEAVKVVEECGKKGAVHMVFYEREDMKLPEIGICNCCWDCCGILGTYNRGITGLHFTATGIAVISNPEKCVGCGKCIKYCPVNALCLEGKKISINEKLCIGCGQCAVQCGLDVFTIETGEREVLLPLLKPSEARLV